MMRASKRCRLNTASDGGLIFTVTLVARFLPAKWMRSMTCPIRYQRLLDEGRYASISEMAAAEKIERGYLGSLLRLTLLAPNNVEAILEGCQAETATLPRFLEPFPAEWTAQCRALNAGWRGQWSAPHFDRTPGAT